MAGDIIEFNNFEVLDASSFSSLVEARRRDAVSTAEKIANNIIAAAPEVAAIRQGLQIGTKYQLVIDPETMKKIEKGLLEFQKSGDKLKTVLIDPNTKQIVKHLEVSVEKAFTGIDPVMMAQNIQNFAMQQQLQDIAEDLKTIEARLEYAVRGLHNDRVALYKSGQALYLMAQSTKDDGLRKQLVAQALSTLSMSAFQLMEEASDNIKSLSANYDADKVKMYNMKKEEVAEAIKTINMCFEAIHKSFYLQTGILYEQNETEAMVAALNTYGKFLRETLTENVSKMLYQYDDTDRKLEGKWRDRSGVLPERIDKMKEQYLLCETVGTPIAELEGEAI